MRTAILLAALIAVSANAQETLPHRETGIDAQGHLPAWLTAQQNGDLCAGHVKEVLTQPSGALLIVCRPELLTPKAAEGVK